MVNNHDIVPEVSFDIALGRKYRQVEFDYDAYQQLVLDLGGTPEDLHGLRMEFYSEKCATEDGFYNYEENTIGINLAHSKVGEAIAHETQHYVDVQNGMLPSKASIAAANIAVKVHLSGLVLCMVGSGLTVYRSWRTGELPEILSAPTSLMFLPPTIGEIAFRSFYTRNAREKRAYKTGKKFGDRVVLEMEKR